MAKKKTTPADAPEGRDVNAVIQILEAREAYHLERAKSSEHTASSYRRACVKDKAMHLTLQASWHKAEARELRKMIEEMQ